MQNMEYTFLLFNYIAGGGETKHYFFTITLNIEEKVFRLPTQFVNFLTEYFIASQPECFCL